MTPSISPEEAAEALRQVEASRATFRAALSAYRGYQHLWLWGAVWMGQSLSYQLGGSHRIWLWYGFLAAGVAGSFLIGVRQSGQVRAPVDRRFLGVLATVILFGLFVWPLVLHGLNRDQTWAAYSALVAMQCYIVAGIWFDSYLLVVGILVSILIFVGYRFFPDIFWWWMALFGGGTLIASGTYVKHAWR